MSANPQPTEIPDILVHAGFHKTGTSSLQTFLDINKTLLADHFLSYGKDDFLTAGARARRYGQRPYRWRMRRFRRAFRAFLDGLPDGQRIVLSRETFSGIMPGHRRLFRPVRGYRPAAPRLARAIVAELRRRFGNNVKIAFLYTTRDQNSWHRSVYGHLLRSIRLTRDFKAFRAALDGRKLDDEVEDIRRAIHPVPVHTAALERLGRAPAGPAEAVLDIMGVPAERRARLIPAGRVNAGQSLGTLEEFLTLNRTMRDTPALKAAKEALATKERKSHG